MLVGMATILIGEIEKCSPYLQVLCTVTLPFRPYGFSDTSTHPSLFCKHLRAQLILNDLSVPILATCCYRASRYSGNNLQ